MGEKRSGKLAGWLKTLGGTVAGLVSGVVMMYVTGFVNNVVKPAKPVPIFSYDHENLAVTFHNRSTGGTSGYWDFGDGSPLEPISPKQELVTHTYHGLAEVARAFGDDPARPEYVKGVAVLS